MCETADMEVLQKELRSLNQASRLTSAVNDVDQIISELTAAREQVAASSSPPSATPLLY